MTQLEYSMQTAEKLQTILCVNMCDTVYIISVTYTYIVF